MKKPLLALLVLAVLAALAFTVDAAINVLNLKPAASGQNVWARTAPGHVNNLVLAASTVETNAVPTSARFVFFASTGNFYARPDGTVTVPGADITDGTGGEVTPTVWDVSTVTNIMVIAPAACVVTLSFYK